MIKTSTLSLRSIFVTRDPFDKQYIQRIESNVFCERISYGNEKEGEQLGLGLFISVVYVFKYY